MATVELTPQSMTPTETRLATKADEGLAKLKGFEIKTPEDYERAATLAQFFQAGTKETESEFKGIKQKAFELHRSICDSENRLLRKYKDGLSVLKGLMEKWLLDVRERERAAQIALEREQRALQEQSAMAEAEALAASGEHEQAEMVLEMAIEAPLPPVTVTTSVPKVSGAITRKTWAFEITDIEQINPQFLLPKEANLGMIKECVKSNKEHSPKIVGKGLRVWERESIAVKA